VSVLNGVVLVSSIRQALAAGLAPDEAVARGCDLRFRAIVVSAIVAIIGFLPAALSQSIGAEIQRRLARVVVGGLSSTALTLLVLPAAYALRSRRETDVEPPRSRDPRRSAAARPVRGCGSGGRPDQAGSRVRPWCHSARRTPTKRSTLTVMRMSGTASQ
jgi:predicted RND superfamily exporter protein